MIKFYTIVVIFCLLLANVALAQDVAIFYDGSLPALSINNAPGFAELLVQELKKNNIRAGIVDKDELVTYMKANPQGIMLVCQGIFPGTIFANKGKEDLIHSWLRGGGIGGFVGDYPFYYWDNTNNVAAGGGQQKVFGVTVTNGTVSNVKPTELGKKYMPSLKDWTTNRPVGLAALENNGFEFESYADDGVNADPIAYRTKDMKGWFINFHTSCCGTACPPNEQMAKEYGELIANRFIDKGKLSVKPIDKLGVTWGQLKLNR